MFHVADDQTTTDEVVDMALQPNRLLTLGITSCGGSSSCNFALARLEPDGGLDPTFGTGGAVSTGLGGFEEVGGIAIQDDGLLLLGGMVCRPGTSCDFALLRYRRHGKIDEGFGQQGHITTSFGGQARAADIELRPNGKVIAAGATCPSPDTCDFAMVRYTGNGVADTTFGTNGKVVTDAGGDDDARAMAIADDNKIVVAGVSSSDILLARYDDDRPTLKIFTLISSDYRRGAFEGRIETDRRRCNSHRRVEVHHRKDGVVGSTRSDRRGRWRLSDDQAAGGYWATTDRKTYATRSGLRVICQAGRSENVWVNR
jgi:uncharacterized delta-60 repeat protein